MHQPSRDVSRSAAAAGPTIRANTSSTPTTCAASATAIATIARNSTEISRSDTPFASASSGASVAKSSGRETNARAPRLKTLNPASVHTVSRLTPSRLPNRIAVAWVAWVV